MAVKKILTISKHEKFLHTKSEPVKKINREIKQLIEDIKDTIEVNPAVGLAAPQIGVLKRVVGVRLSFDESKPKDQNEPPIILINPEVLEESTDVEEGDEGCLSIPGMVGIVTRKLKLHVRYMDEKGKTVERTFEGWDARVVQHEVDHLDGVLFLERLNSLEDLFVLVADEEGHVEPVPYLEVTQAASPADPKPLTRTSKDGARSLAEPGSVQNKS